MMESHNFSEKKSIISHFFENDVNAIMVATSPDGRCIYANRKATQITGYTKNELHQKSLLSIIHPLEKEKLLSRFKTRISGKKAVSIYETVIVNHKGVSLAIEVSGKRIDWFGQVGNLIRFRDISQRKKTEDLLRQSEMKFKGLFNTMHSGVAIYEAVDEGKDFIFRNFNPAGLKIDRIHKKDVIGRKVTEVFPGVKALGLLAVFRKVWKTGKPFYQPRTFYHDKRISSWRENYVFKLKTGEVVAIYDDVTDKVLKEEQLIESEARYRLIFESSIDGILIVDIKTKKIVFANPIICQLLGYTISEVQGKKTAELLPRKEASYFWAEAVSLSSETKGKMLDIIFCHKNGYVIDTEVYMTKTVFNAKNCLIGYIRDVTQKKKAEERLQLLEAGIKNAVDAFIICDRDGKVQYVNKAFESITGYSFAEIKEKTNYMITICPENSAAHKSMMKGIKSGVSWQGELTNRKKDGSLFTSHTSISPIFNSDGQITSHIAIIKDISREKKLEEQLFQAVKMETIGKMTGGVAHDFNNLLTIINGYAEILLLKHQGEKIENELKQILQAGRKAADLTDKILTFSRKQPIKPVITNINENILELQKMARRIVGENIKLILKLEPSLNYIRIDHSQLEQIMMNLVVNARDAMKKGGTITIETQNMIADKPFVQAYPYFKPGKYVVLMVSDTGTGIDPSIQKQIFDPFFTTKKRGQGTGLGLSTVYGIVKQNKAYINLYSEKNKGACFKIYFPVYKKIDQVIKQEKNISNLNLKDYTVLIVEDEDNVRYLTESYFKSIGFNTLSAVNGENAVNLARICQDPINLIFIDMIMPGISGKQAVKKIKRIHPEARVVFSSGYPMNHRNLKNILQESVFFIKKPYSKIDLVNKLKDIFVIDNRNNESGFSQKTV